MFYLQTSYTSCLTRYNFTWQDIFSKILMLHTAAIWTISAECPKPVVSKSKTTNFSFPVNSGGVEVFQWNQSNIQLDQFLTDRYFPLEWWLLILEFSSKTSARVFFFYKVWFSAVYDAIPAFCPNRNPFAWWTCLERDHMPHLPTRKRIWCGY